MRITTYKLELVKEKATNYGSKEFNVTSPEHVVDFLIDVCKLDKQSEEVLGLICLDTKCKIIGYHEVSRGTLNSSLIHPREIFKRALLNNANSIMLTHNHPSGSTEPSGADKKVTEKIKTIGEMMGISLLDHIIVGDGQYYSFRESSSIY